MNTVSFPAVQMMDLHKTFRTGERTTEALRGVSAEVKQGEFLAVMGASGSGKSTLLHLIAGLTPADSGEIRVGEESPLMLSDAARTCFRRRKIGIIFQSFNLISTLTVEDNILLPLLAESSVAVKSARPRLEKLLERLGLTAMRGSYPGSLSGGEQQRVAIARALIANPELILADEPTGSLDSVNGERVCSLLREVTREQSKTVILVTHEPAVGKWADRILILRDGMIVSAFATSDYPDPYALAVHYQDVMKG